MNGHRGFMKVKMGMIVERARDPSITNTVRDFNASQSERKTEDRKRKGNGIGYPRLSCGVR